MAFLTGEGPEVRYVAPGPSAPLDGATVPSGCAIRSASIVRFGSCGERPRDRTHVPPTHPRPSTALTQDGATCTAVQAPPRAVPRSCIHGADVELHIIRQRKVDLPAYRGHVRLVEEELSERLAEVYVGGRGEESNRLRLEGPP